MTKIAVIYYSSTGNVHQLAEALAEGARDAGAEVVMEPTDQDYGSRDMSVRDPEGNLWSFGTYDPEAPQ